MLKYDLRINAPKKLFTFVIMCVIIMIISFYYGVTCYGKRCFHARIP